MCMSVIYVSSAPRCPSPIGKTVQLPSVNIVCCRSAGPGTSIGVHQVRDQPRERAGQGTATWRWPPAQAGAPITHEPHRRHGDPLTHPLTPPVDLWMTANSGRRRRPNPSPRPSLQEGSESASDPNGHGGGATPMTAGGALITSHLVKGRCASVLTRSVLACRQAVRRVRLPG